MCSEYVCAIARVSAGMDFATCGPTDEHEPDRRQKLMRDEKRKIDNGKGKRSRKKNRRPREGDI